MIHPRTSKIVLLWVLLPFGLVAQLSSNIVLNQIGFYPESQKIAILVNSPDTLFSVINAQGIEVFKGKTGPARNSKFSSKVLKVADFSEVTTTGTYTVRAPLTGTSISFDIKPNVFADLLKASIKSYYYQRCSSPIPVQYGGKWARKAGHSDKRVLVHPSASSPLRTATATIEAGRGWYDAGDYSKYIVNSGITMGTLLSSWEQHAGYWRGETWNIPETKNKIPDLLDEVLYNLRWMLRMQDPADGGVYHKLTNAQFDGMVMPDQANTPRYVVMKSTAATLDFCAVMAQSARVYKPFSSALPGLADSCLQASIRAWQWAKTHNAVYYDQVKMNASFEPDIATGAYDDSILADEFIWAAAELFTTTREEAYIRATNLLPDNKMPVPSWSDVRLLGYYTLLRDSGNVAPSIRPILNEIKRRLVKEAERITLNVHATPYQIVWGRSNDDFVWGSNAVAANQSILLFQVYFLTKQSKFLTAAAGNLDYILGRNATGFSFVTGYGHKTPKHPHHRPSEADGIEEPIPGFLVGGPNTGMQDKCTYPSMVADEAYVDDVCSYASNEVAINWNAPLVYVLAALQSIHSGK